MKTTPPSSISPSPSLSSPPLIPPLDVDPHILHLCETDSLMSSHSQQLLSSGEAQRFSLETIIPSIDLATADPVNQVSVDASLSTMSSPSPQNGTSVEPDPRWPYLNRWTQKSPSSPLVNSLVDKETTQVVQPEMESAPSLLHKSSDDSVSVAPSVLVPPTKNINSTEAPPSSSSSPLASPLKGAWKTPLNLNRRSDNINHSMSVDPKLTKKSNVVDVSLTSSVPLALSMDSHPDAAHEDDLRFPWAAKMDPSSRNLYRATSPEYMEDGTPKVIIPSHVLLQGLENQKEYVLGQFYRCNSPPGGLVHAVVNRIWGRKCRIFVRKLGESKFLFHIPDASTRAWVLQRGLWHVDECLLFVAPWSTEDSLALPDISTVPVWVTLKNIPNQLYSIPGISHIASGLGAPMATYKPRLDPTLMGEAKILVEVELSKAFPSRIAAADKKGSIAMVDVEYAWIPTKCGKCGHLGHKASRCASDEAAPPGDASNSAATVMASPKTVISDPIISDSVTDSEAHVTTITINAAPINSDHCTMVVANQSNVDTDVVAKATSTIQRERVIAGTKDKEVPSGCSTLVTKTSAENVLGNNMFIALDTSEPDENSHDSEIDSEMLDLMTPFGQRLLRERPVKPSFKAKEMASSKARGRGNRGRGNRGRRG